MVCRVWCSLSPSLSGMLKHSPSLVDKMHYPSLGGSTAQCAVRRPWLQHWRTVVPARSSPPGVVDAGGDAKFVEQSLAMRRMFNYLKMTTTYLSGEPESWVPPAPPWFLGLVKNVRRNLPICTSSPLTSTAESTASRLT
ncbi:MAG: hypothetical protein QOE94_893 [Mycobacterium sp.]|nr:hypothetical protein [Mycobacterium sp.]